MEDSKTSEQPTPRIIDLQEIMKGNQEVLIQHGDVVYRLHLTKNNRLILQK